MHKGYFIVKKEENIFQGPKTPKRYQKGHQTLDDKINMIYDVLIKKEKLADVA